MMTDPIADMLTRIRNAVRIERATVDLPSSKVKRGLAEVLKREGFIWDWKEVESEPVPQIRIELKYGPNGERLIRHIRRVSSPGRRVYSRSVRLRPVLGGLGISILSTSSGVVSDREARQRALGPGRGHPARHQLGAEEPLPPMRVPGATPPGVLDRDLVA